MTFFEAREFCRSDNATMPFIRGSNDVLWLYLQRQMMHLQYPDKVWIQDLNHLEQCTSFIYRSVEIDECDNKRGFICEIDPKVNVLPKMYLFILFIEKMFFSHFRSFYHHYLGKLILLLLLR